MIEITVHHLRLIMPLIGARADVFVDPLNRSMEEWEINNPLREAAFLAQLAHESGEFRYMRELADGKAYEGRKDLGNVHEGDGKKYKGRGPIQITGYDNYQKCSLALYADERLLDQPELLEQPLDGCRAAGWFWKKKSLNQFADGRNFREITRRINGGYNGYEEREQYYERALEVMGILE